MIFSKEHAYIYIRVPKTASTTLSSWLLNLDPSATRDEIELADGTKKPVHTHASAQELKSILGNEFDKYRVVAFVRDPVDLIASKYFFYRRARDRIVKNRGWARLIILFKILSVYSLPLSVWALLYPYKKSADFILDHTGTSLATDVGSFDSLEDDFARIFSDIGLKVDGPGIGEAKNVNRYDRQAPKRNLLLKKIALMRFKKDYVLISKTHNYRREL